MRSTFFQLVRRRPRRSICVGFLALFAFAVLLLAVTPQGRTGVKSMLFVTQVLGALPINPQEWFTQASIRERVEFPLTEGMGTADIYRPPGDGPYPAVLVFLGVAPAGPDDPRVLNLGDALARAGLVNMFYWSPQMLDKRVDTADVHNLATAFDYLREQPFVDGDRVGMGGFCVGASFALVSASLEEIRDDVNYVYAFTPYFDATDLTRSIASGTRFYNGETEPWEVDSLSREVFEIQLIESLDDEQEQDRVLQALGGDEAARESLSTEGMAVYRLMEGVPLEETYALMDQLPPDFVQDLEYTSPVNHLEGLEAKVLVMHDQDDNLVPSEESRRLYEALERRDHDVYYTEFEFFQHVDPSPVSPLAYVRESWKLFLQIYNLFRVAT